MFDVDPDRWMPDGLAYHRHMQAKVGLKVAWRYAVWRIVDIRDLHEANWDDADRAYLDRQPPEFRHPPRAIVLKHLNGPLLLDGEGLDSRGELHLSDPARSRRLWIGVNRRYPVCSCCGHPWPCVLWDRDRLVAGQAQRTERLLAGARPGVCQACREPIGRRQRSVTFPEPSLLVPGAPGPSYHVGRTVCWQAARDYETGQRMAAHPAAHRLVSCPGHVVVHEIGLRMECTAGPACTGLHRPWGDRRPLSGTCMTRVHVAWDLAAGYRRPLSDCGYRRGRIACLGSESGPCESLPDGIADLFGGQ